MDFPAFGVSECEKSFPTGQAEPRKQWNNTDQKRQKSLNNWSKKLFPLFNEEIQLPCIKTVQSL